MNPRQEEMLDEVRLTVAAINERTIQHEKRMDRAHKDAQKGGASMGAIVSVLINGVVALFSFSR